MKDRRLGRLSGALALTAVLLVAACGSGGKEAAKNPTTQTLKIASPTVPNSLDPERYEGLISMSVLPNISSTLLRLPKPAPGATALARADKLEGELAESWEPSADGKTVKFTLREAKSAFGNTVTSEDVRWSVDRMMQSKGSAIGKFLALKAGWAAEKPITVVDDKNFVLNVTTPQESTLPVATLYFFNIYDSVEAKKHATADDPFAYDWLSEHSASFGPYTVKSVDAGKRIELTANKNYFRGGSQFSDVVIQAVGDASSRIQLIQRGDVDAVTDLPYDQLAALEKDKAVQLARSIYTNIDMLAPLNKVKPLDDKRVRQALSYGIDREQLVKSAYKGFGQPADDFFHPAFGFEVPAASPLTYDPEKAKKLLADAGYPNGFKMTLTYNVANVGSQSEQVAVLLRSQLAKIGVEVAVTAEASGADFDAAKRAGKLQSWLGTSFSMLSVLPFHMLTMYGADGVANQEQFRSAHLDKILTESMRMPYGAERNALLVEASDILFDEVPLIPLVDTVKYFVFKPNIKGFLSAPVANITYFDLSTG
jgi:peptide/nickel transport system substrate-binding protein